jgi:hypothetical protein
MFSNKAENRQFFEKEIILVLYLKIILGIVVISLVAVIYVKNIRSELK